MPKNKLSNDFEDKYLKVIHEIYVGYNNLSIQDILAYLYNYFRKVSTLELEEAEKHL